MRPPIGSYTMLAPTPAGTYYPGNGKGSAVANTDDSICRDSQECLITFVTTPSTSTGVHEISFYHEDGTLAAYFAGANDSGRPGVSFDVGGPEGFLITGSWYVTTAGSSTRLSFAIGFKIIT